MYEEFFGISEKPFSIQPDPSFLYWGRGHRLAYAMLEYGVLNHAGISVITGEVGCGKTTLIHRLLDQLSDTHTVSLLSNIQAGRGDLLSWVLMGFGQPFAGKSHVELFSQLQLFFVGEYAKGKRIVLIIDEAQNLSIDMLEELRMLSNINAGKDQLLQLILVGQPQLKELLNRPEMLQLAQRVGSDFHLTPLNLQEVRDYLDTRLTIAGCRRRIFTDRAVDLIAEQSRGVPRVINIIADTALVYAFSEEDLVVGVETIRSVIRDKIDYGVFGLASDQNAVPPIKSNARKGPAAFIAGADNEDHEPPAAGPRGNGEADAQEPAASPARPLAPADNQALEGDAPPVAAVSDQQAQPESVQPEAIALADFKSIVTAKLSTSLDVEQKERPLRETEQSAVTGIVVIGMDPNISPEAAVRSCGDGRAVVFVAFDHAPDLVAIARRAGAVIVDGGGKPFNTGGRARNAGYRQLKKIAPHMRYVQFIDAKDALDPDWLNTAERFMERRPEVSVIEGWPRNPNIGLPSYASMKEKHDRETEGEIQAVVSSAMMRATAFEAVGGFRGDLVTAETKDLCLRLRRRGSHVWRLREAMTISQPHKDSVGKWWRERKNIGYEHAYCASLHGGPPERLGVIETARAALWGFLVPAGILAAAALSALGATYLAPLTPTLQVFEFVLLAGVAIYAVKIIVAAFNRGALKPSSWKAAFFVVFGAVPEFIGVLRHVLGRPRRAGAARAAP